jgi:hypothetical protein
MGLALPLGVAASSATVTSMVDITNDEFADNEESVGLSPDGSLMAGAWNDWDYNDGCGFSYSTDGGQSWAPHTFVPGLTIYTNDPSIAGTGSFGIAGDPAVAFNPSSNKFDIVCQAFGAPAKGTQIQLLSTTFDPARANPNADENASYGARAWTKPVAITTGTSNGTQKGSNGKFPDHESITVDVNRASTHFGRAYVVWAEFNGSYHAPIDLAYSDNDGLTWTGPIRVSDGAHKFDQDARATIGPDGRVYVSFLSGPNANSSGSEIDIAASSDAGNSFGPTHAMAPLINPIAGLLPNSRYRVFSDVWSSATGDGLVTAVFNDGRTGHSNIYAVHNLFPGDLSSWTAPVAVKASSKEEFFPWIVASPGGDRLDLTFYDRSYDPGNTLTAVDYAASWNNGDSWTVKKATAGRGVDLDTYQACLAFLQPSNCGSYFIGDYISVTSTQSTVHLVYTWNGPHAMDAFETNLSY